MSHFVVFFFRELSEVRTLVWLRRWKIWEDIWEDGSLIRSVINSAVNILFESNLHGGKNLKTLHLAEWYVRLNASFRFL